MVISTYTNTMETYFNSETYGNILLPNGHYSLVIVDGREYIYGA